MDCISFFRRDKKPWDGLRNSMGCISDGTIFDDLQYIIHISPWSALVEVLNTLEDKGIKG